MFNHFIIYKKCERITSLYVNFPFVGNNLNVIKENYRIVVKRSIRFNQKGNVGKMNLVIESEGPTDGCSLRCHQFRIIIMINELTTPFVVTH